MHSKPHSTSNDLRETEAEFVAMVKRHEALIYKVCLTFTRRQPDEVEDLKQDVLCNLWRGYGGFKGESKESTWIYRVALNTGIQFYRRNQRMPRTEELTPRMAECYVGDDDQRQLDTLYTLIHRLDDEEQKLLFMYLDGVSGAEMAEALGIGQGNVRIRLHRIKTKLKKMAQRYENE